LLSIKTPEAMLTRGIVKKIGFGSAGVVVLCADTGEAISETLVVLVGGVLEEAVCVNRYVSKEGHIDR
jgi:hypothetical protein